jgi:hypothetical protein
MASYTGAPNSVASQAFPWRSMALKIYGGNTTV